MILFCVSTNEHSYLGFQATQGRDTPLTLADYYTHVTCRDAHIRPLSANIPDKHLAPFASFYHLAYVLRPVLASDRRKDSKPKRYAEVPIMKHHGYSATQLAFNSSENTSAAGCKR